jgi:hypothetical protein
MVASAHADVLQRLIEGGRAPISADMARIILSWSFADSDRSRVTELSGKARAGTLLEAEREELDWYLMLADLLAVLHSKARAALSNRPSAA